MKQRMPAASFGDILAHVVHRGGMAAQFIAEQTLVSAPVMTRLSVSRRRSKAGKSGSKKGE
jgi:hypothetical protein